jgi:hypothetical protein
VWGTIVVGMVDNVVTRCWSATNGCTVLSFIAVVGGLMLLGGPGVVLSPLIVAVSDADRDLAAARRPGRGGRAFSSGGYRFA